MEYVYHLLISIAFIMIGWKLQNDKVDENTLMPGDTLEGVTHKRKVRGNTALVTGGYT